MDATGLRRRAPAPFGPPITEHQPACPLCQSPTVLRTARRGPGAGQQFWGCSRYPTCRGTRPLTAARATGRPLAGQSAQSRFERERDRTWARRRRLLPVILVSGLLGAVVVFFGTRVLVNDTVASLLAAAAALLALYAAFEMPHGVAAWKRGAEGERRTDRYLAGLVESGYVVLHDRRVPGGRGNIDHVVIGPTGVYVVETKSWSGQLAVEDNRLYVDGRLRDGAAEQVTRAAAAVQVALVGELKPLAMTVTPILCFHRTDLPLFRRSVRGVAITGGRGLSRRIREGEPVLGADAVQALAAAADERLLPASSGA